MNRNNSEFDFDDVASRLKTSNRLGCMYSSAMHFITLIFIALKLTGAITWSWWLVCAPSLLVLAGGVVGLVLLAILIVTILIVVAVNK